VTSNDQRLEFLFKFDSVVFFFETVGSFGTPGSVTLFTQLLATLTLDPFAAAFVARFAALNSRRNVDLAALKPLQMKIV
jgi:hypothetical protein